MIRKDWFIHPDCEVLQDPDAFCFNTDTVLLAKFMKVRQGERLLDIGTNNGVLLKYARQFVPSALIGVEVQQEAAALARTNVPEGEIHCGRVQDLQIPPVDVVIANPPFFPDSGIRDARRRAREEQDLRLEELVEAAFRLLKSNGRFYLVHRPYRLQEITVLLARNHFGLKRLEVVQDRRDGQVKAILAEAVKERLCSCTITVQEIGS